MSYASGWFAHIPEAHFKRRKRNSSVSQRPKNWKSVWILQGNIAYRGKSFWNLLITPSGRAPKISTPRKPYKL